MFGKFAHIRELFARPIKYYNPRQYGGGAHVVLLKASNLRNYGNLFNIFSGADFQQALQIATFEFDHDVR